MSLKDQLRKTVFLIALASAARISELSTLCRGPDYVKFLPSGEVSLSPDRLFLAKNEKPDKRWSPWLIVPLRQLPLLCPVTALRKYLSMTKDIEEGQLFRGETCGSKLSAKQLSSKLIFSKEGFLSE